MCVATVAVPVSEEWLPRTGSGRDSGKEGYIDCPAWCLGSAGNGTGTGQGVALFLDLDLYWVESGTVAGLGVPLLLGLDREWLVTQR